MGKKVQICLYIQRYQSTKAYGQHTSKAHEGVLDDCVPIQSRFVPCTRHPIQAAVCEPVFHVRELVKGNLMCTSYSVQLVNTDVHCQIFSQRTSHYYELELF